jgi:hypothetical protein
MRFLWVMSAMLASSVACQKDPALSTSAKTAGASAPSSAGANVSASDKSAGDSDRVVEKHALSPSTSPGVSAATTPTPALGGNRLSGDPSKPDDGNGEPMDDVDDAVPATDKSGVDNVVDRHGTADHSGNGNKDDDDSDGTDIQVEE